MGLGIVGFEVSINVTEVGSTSTLTTVFSTGVVRRSGR